MTYQIIEAAQGSEEWHQARKDCFTASEAPAALGVSKYQTRDELLAQKKTGLVKPVDEATQRLFDRGHQSEALARSIAEVIIGEELYPITAKVIDCEFPLLASMDGLTLTGDIGFEHKLLSAALVEQIKAGDLQAHYTVQMDQQILVTGCEKILFMTSDGTQENCHWMWYQSTSKKQAALLAGWEQFARDLADYVPPVQVEKVVAGTVEALPVPSVVVRGEITQSNITEITPKFDAYLDGIKKELRTDQDFVDADENAKNCEATEKRIQALRENIIAQMVSVNEVDSALAKYQKAFKDMKVFLKNAVNDQKESIKTQAIMKAQASWMDHINALQDDCEPVTLRQHLTSPDFAGAIKGIKTIASMHSRINDALAAGKAQATQFADDVRIKIELINTSIVGYEHLFNVPSLAVNDLRLIKLEIQSVKDQEDSRKAEYEAAIQAKAEADARAKVEAEQLAKQLAEQQAKPTAAVYGSSSLKAAREQNDTGLTPQLDQEFAKTFTATTTKPTSEQIVSLVADHYGVTQHQAKAWLNDLFYKMAA